MNRYDPLLRYPLASCVEAFSTTREGGCSEGAYSSMNCTPYTGDEPAHVAENQHRLHELLTPGTALVIPYQTHGTQVLEVDDCFLTTTHDGQQALLQATDALITQHAHVALCISTADCIPLLLYDAAHHAIAAVHAGWRGTVAGIALHTLEKMAQRYGTQGADVHAVIGPGISIGAFEVGHEVYEAFRDAGFPMERIAEWNNPMHKWHIDLPEANRLQLLRFGVPTCQIIQTGLCTYTLHERFFSARRLGIRSGRILSGISLIH